MAEVDVVAVVEGMEDMVVEGMVECMVVGMVECTVVMAMDMVEAEDIMVEVGVAEAIMIILGIIPGFYLAEAVIVKPGVDM
jgi:hypothetical protein